MVPTHRSFSYRFQQDGAALHKAKSTSRWMENNNVRPFNGNNWPPCSPDMNPVEHIWPLVTKMLAGQVYSGREDRWIALEAAFHSIPQEKVIKLYNSMSSRLQALKRAKGGHTRY